MSTRTSIKQKILFFIVSIIALAAAGSGLYVYVVFGDDVSGMINRRDKASQYDRIAFFDQRDSRLVDFIAHENIAENDLPAFCNNLIFEKSTKGYVDEYNRKVTRIMGMLADHIGDPNQPKPLTKCDSRALVLGSLMKAFGFQVRIVHTMGYTKGNEFMGHTFVEVKEKGGWSLYDPYFGISYKNQGGDTPVSALLAVLSGIDDLVPVSPSGEGWEANADRVDKQFMDRIYCLAIYDNRMNGEKSTIVINSSRIERITEGALSGELDETLRGYLKNKWFDPVIIRL